MKGLSQLRTSAVPYLVALVLTVVLARFSQYLWQYVWPGIPTIYGQAPGIYVQFVGLAIAATLWLVYRGDRTSQPLLIAFLALLLVSWFLFLTIARLHQDGFAYEVFLYPLVVTGLLFKTPRGADLLVALKTAGWAVVVVLVSTRAAELLGWIPEVYVGEYLQNFEVSNYWLPFAGTLGPEGRWPGPFGHNAMTGNAAVMLVVMATALKGTSRWVFGFVGVLTLLLASSRTSFLAAALGVAAVIAFGDNAITRRLSSRTVLLGSGVLVALAGLLMIMNNTHMTGRTQFWAASIEVWRQSPLLGVGATGMTESQAAFAGLDAHNIVVDALLKTGVVGASLVVAIVVLALTLAWKSARLGSVLPLGILVAYSAIGLAQSDDGWTELSMSWMWLALAATFAGQELNRQESRKQLNML